MVAVIHIKHETKASGRAGVASGELNIVFNPTSTTLSGQWVDPIEHPAMLELIFEDSETGAFYESSFMHDRLCEHCVVFCLIDEIPDVLADTPVIMKDIVGATWVGTCPRVAVFKYRTSKGREYQIILPLHPRVYPEGEHDFMELKQENSVLRKKVAALEERVIALESICTKLVTDVRITNDHVVISGYDLFNSDYNTIMNAVDRGFDLNNIRGRPELSINVCSDEMPLIFKVVNDHERAGGSIDNRVLLFSKSIMFIKYLLSKEYDPNVTYNGKTVIQTLGHVKDPKLNMLKNAFHKSCIEYCEYCDTLCEMLREAGAK